MIVSPARATYRYSYVIQFALLLPLLLAMSGVPPLVAVVIPVVVFGLSHIYQGVAGVIGTMVIGLGPDSWRMLRAA